jgi:hypothetical protein
MLSASTLTLGFLVAGSWWGGKAPDEAAAITRDDSGFIYVAGTTHSLELAEAGGGLSARPSRHSYPGDIFVQKMTTSGSLVWRAVLGGSNTDKALAIAVDASNAVYVAGITYSLDFPASATAFRKSSGNARALAGDAFLVKLTAEGNRILYATYYGGAESDQANALTVDASGQAVIAGETVSDDLPVSAGPLAAKPCAGFGYDGFVAKFNATGTGLLFGSYLCGSGHDHPRALALDAQGAVYVAGDTASADFPVTRGAFRERPASYNFDAFALKLAADGKTVEWGTYYGGGESERVSAMALDSQGRILLAGETRSTDLPGVAKLPVGMQDGFAVRISSAGKTVDWARIFGGTREDHPTGVELGSAGELWVGGWTRSTDWAGDPAGGEDSFLVRIPANGDGEIHTARLGGPANDRVQAIRIAGPFVAAVGRSDNTTWIGDGKTGAGQGDAFIALTESRAVGQSAVETPETRARKPESGWSLWSGLGRVPFEPSAPVAAGRRWIVELAEPPAARNAAAWRGLRGLARESELVRERSAVRRRQAAARAAVQSAGGRLYGSADLVANVLFVEAEPEIADRIRSLADVQRVLPVASIHPDLDSTHSTHKIVEAFQRIGGEANAGAGIKVGIVDTGVDARHPAFADPGLPPLDGFPRANKQADLANTSAKVIVARGYMPAGDNAHSKDDVGHGSGVAAVAAGSRSDSPLGPVSGVAPYAFIGNYKMLTNESSAIAGDDALILALEDAAADGMDVLNLGLHTSRLLLRPEDDIYSDICERLVFMGIMVIRSTGNEGPEWSTLTNPHFGEWGILVGSHVNARTAGTNITLADGTQIFSIPGSNTEMGYSGEVAGPLAEVQRIAPGTWGCSALPADSLKGKIALIDRGGCNFSVKGENARRAGAIGMIVMALAEAPNPFSMSMASERIPAFMVSHADGQQLRAKAAESSPPEAKIPLSWTTRPDSPDLMASSSSAGPGMSTRGIKPDLVATGDSVWTARAAGGWALASGTSFSSPHVAGAMTVLVGQRPGLDPRQYRSLIVNSATPITGADGKTLPVMRQGAGRLNLDAALASTVTAYPTSLHLGSGRGELDVQKAFKLMNLAAQDASCAIAVEPRDGDGPIVEPERVDMGAAGEAWVVLTWKASGLKPGQYEGHLRVRCDGAEYPLSIPYWHGVSGGKVTNIKLTSSVASGKAGQTLYWAAEFRLVDEAGLPVDGAKPVVTVKSGSGTLVDLFSRASIFPGIYAIHVKPAAGQTVFQIAIDGLTREFTVTGE